METTCTQVTLKSPINEIFASYCNFLKYCREHDLHTIEQLDNENFWEFEYTQAGNSTEKRAVVQLWERLMYASLSEYDVRKPSETYKRLKAKSDRKKRDLLEQAIGKEMVEYAEEDLDRLFSFIGLFKLSVSEFDQINFIKSKSSNRIREAASVLGEANCIGLLSSYRGATTTIEMLSRYSCNGDNDNVECIWMNSVAKENLQGRIYWLLQVARLKGAAAFRALCANLKIERVHELKSINTISVSQDEFRTLASFVSWLQKDRRKQLMEDVQKINGNERNMRIVDGRSRGMTLEALGLLEGITRERVRQIEKKFLTSYKRYDSRHSPLLVIAAFSKEPNFITIDDITEVYGQLGPLAIYSMKHANSSLATWCEELNGFIIGDSSWYKQLELWMDSLPAIIDVQTAKDMAFKYCESNQMPIASDKLFEAILKDYNVSGQVCSRTKLRLSQMYLKVLEKHYPDGIKLYNKLELTNFKKHFRSMFGDMDLPNDRAIDARLAAVTVLRDRGKYILADYISVTPGLLRSIYNYISKSDRTVFMFGELFDYFSDDLFNESNIDNKYFLQGVLKYYYSNEFWFSRDTISKNKSDYSIAPLVEELINCSEEPIAIADIKNNFPGVTHAVISMAVFNNPSILRWDFNRYIHKSKIHLSDNEAETIREMINRCVENEPITSRKLYELVGNEIPKLLFRKDINNHFALFSLAEYLFVDEYEFKRPFIGIKGITLYTTHKAVQNFIRENDSFRLSELKEYCDSLHIQVIYETVLDQIKDDYVRVDSDVCIRKDELFITDNIIAQIEEITSGYMFNMDYISLTNIDNYFFFPDIGMEWNGFLLESIIKTFSNNLEIIELDNRNYNILSGIIAVNGRFENYEDLLQFALKAEQEKSPFSDTREMEEWLRGQGLINKRSPLRLFDQEFVDENDVLAETE